MWNSAGQNVPKCADDYDLGDWVSENEGGKLRYALLAPQRRRQAAAARHSLQVSLGTRLGRRAAARWIERDRSAF